MIFSTPYETNIKPIEYDTAIGERADENNSRNPDTAAVMLNAISQPHRYEPSDFKEIEPAIQMMLEDRTHMAKVPSSIDDSICILLTYNAQTENKVDMVPLPNIHPERCFLSSLK